MINLLYEQLPTTVNVEGKSYQIATDFRSWIAFFDMISDDKLDEKSKVYGALEWFTESIPRNITEAYKALMMFMACADLQISHTSTGRSTNSYSSPVLSYLYDSPYIFSAFLQVYNINLRTVEYMHWYEFRALFDGLPEDIPIKKRMAYRCIKLSDIKDKKERERIKRIKSEVRLPSKALTAEQVGNVFG